MGIGSSARNLERPSGSYDAPVTEMPVSGWAALTASIPSPSSPTLSLGPVDLRLYGLLIAVGVVVATRFTMTRWTRRGGDPADILDIIVTVVI
jgi:hypothetical protein